MISVGAEFLPRSMGQILLSLSKDCSKTLAIQLSAQYLIVEIVLFDTLYYNNRLQCIVVSYARVVLLI